MHVTGLSCRRHDNLGAAQAAAIEELLAINELETSRGRNQSTTLKRAGDNHGVLVWVPVAL